MSTADFKPVDPSMAAGTDEHAKPTVNNADSLRLEITMAPPPYATTQRHALRSALPKNAFCPQPARVLVLLLNYLLLLAGLWLVVNSSSRIVWVAVAVAGGINLSSLGFLAHDLSHGTIVRNAYIRYVLELLAWSPVLVPVTMWRITHHRGHHAGANTPLDQDRKPLEKSMSRADRLYFAAFYPHANRVRFNPLIALHFTAFITRLTTALLLWNGQRMPSMPIALHASRLKRLLIVAEIAFIALLQLAFLWLLGGRIDRFAFASLLPIGIASAVGTLYLVTNHFLRPAQIDDDPLGSSTSIVVPRWMDILHSNFSYHVEHHLFPSARSGYYPLLCAELLRHDGDRYHRIRVLDAWRALLKGPLGQIVETPQQLPTSAASLRSM